MSKEEALREAEAMVRKAIARAPEAQVDEKDIKAAARKIARAVPRQRKMETQAAA